MKPTLVPGIAKTAAFTVGDDQTAPHVPVLSTPSMIGLIEGTCMGLAQEHLDDGELTVGTHVCVSHVGTAKVGEEISIDVRLRDIERRRLTFEVRVEGPNGLMSEGTHQRTVIASSRLG